MLKEKLRINQQPGVNVCVPLKRRLQKSTIYNDSNSIESLALIFWKNVQKLQEHCNACTSMHVPQSCIMHNA